MRKLYMVLLGAATITAPALGAAPESTVTGSAATIRSVVSGKTCVGEDTLTFERSGRATGTYSIGYGTVLIRRGKDLHGHVTSVSAQDHLLYMSTGTYRCAK